MDDYENKLRREQEWHTDHEHQADHFLNSRMFYSDERQRYNYGFARKEVAKFLENAARLSGPDEPSILIAPVGTGGDIEHIKHLSDNITGVDVSAEAIARIKDRHVKAICCDMRHMDPFPDDRFDIVLTSLFFHHFRDMLDGFLEELFRVLKPGGHFVAVEPSVLHPVSWATRSLRRIAGNITGQVEDEGPLVPFRLSNAMARCGFQDVAVRGVSFSHNRIPIWLARINNLITYPLLGMPIAKHFAWMCLFHGRKPAPLGSQLLQAGEGEKTVA